MQDKFHWVSNKLYGHNFLGFSTRLQSYIIYLGYSYLPPLPYSVLGRKVCLNRIRAGQLFEVQSSYLNGYKGERAASDSRARLPREGSRGAQRVARVFSVWPEWVPAGPMKKAATVGP